MPSQAEASSSVPNPVWQWKVGNKVWFNLPTGQGRGVMIFQLILALWIEAEGIMLWLADFGGHHWYNHRWISVAVIIGGWPQLLLSGSSLWALRIQKRRDRAAMGS
jgi:hypothetical protein